MRLLRLIANSLPVLISYIDAEKRYQFVNSAYESWFGVKKEDVVGKSIRDVLGESAVQVLAPYMDAALSGRKVEFETEAPYKKGGTRFISGTYVPDVDPDGRVCGIAVLVEDITARKQAERMHQAREHRLNAIVENSPSVLSVKDLDGRYLITNPNFDQVLGIASQEMIGKTDFEIFPYSVAQALLTNDREVQRRKERITFEEEIPSARGETRTFASHKFPIFDRQGNVESVCSISLDITTRKKAEAEREALLESEKRARKDLEKAVRARDEFISIASHELKTPLTSMRMQSQMLERSLSKGGIESISSERLAHSISTSLRQIDRLSRLVEDMLDISRLATGKLTFDISHQDLSQLVKDLAAQFGDDCEQAGCAIQLDIEPGVQGEFDPFRIEQVVANILSNAIKYGGGKPIEISLRREGADFARLKVRDYGIGIPEEAQNRIFDRFERAVSSSNISGLGLGLYITRQILEAHGGMVDVESQPGEGSTFTVILPLKRQLSRQRISERELR